MRTFLSAVALLLLAPAAGPSAVAAGSAFDDYRPMRDQPVEPWRETNDRVARIGGWRTYAREAANATAAPATPVPPGTAAAPASAPVQAMPMRPGGAGPSAAHDRGHGHGHGHGRVTGAPTPTSAPASTPGTPGPGAPR